MSSTSDSDDYGENSGKWTKDQINEYRGREIERNRYTRVVDMLSLMPRSVEEEDWMKDRERKKKRRARKAAKSTTHASPDSPTLTSEGIPIQAPEWALVHDPTGGGGMPATAIKDSGTRVNFIHPKLAAKCHLKSHTTAKVTHKVMTGDTFTSSSWAEVHWYGKDYKCWTAWFYLAPDGAPIDLLVGKDFLEDNPDLEFMDSKPELERALLNVQTKISEQEQAEIEADRAAAEAEAAALARDRQKKREREGEEASSQQQTPKKRK